MAKLVLLELHWSGCTLVRWVNSVNLANKDISGEPQLHLLYIRGTQTGEKVSKRALTWYSEEVAAQTYRARLSNLVRIQRKCVIQRMFRLRLHWLTRSTALADRQLMEQLVLRWEIALFCDAFRRSSENFPPSSKSKLNKGVCKIVSVRLFNRGFVGNITGGHYFQIFFIHRYIVGGLADSSHWIRDVANASRNFNSPF